MATVFFQEYSLLGVITYRFKKDTSHVHTLCKHALIHMHSITHYASMHSITHYASMHSITHIHTHAHTHNLSLEPLV